jgi:hypothetical protein
MNDIFCFEITGRRSLDVTGLAASPLFISRQLETEFFELWSCCAMNGTIHTPAASEFGVGSIDDCVGILVHDVAKDQLNGSMF